VKYLRRLIWFLASRLALFTLLLSLCVVVFYESMNMANIQVILKDGMATRAKVVMGIDDASELTKYFSSAYLARDSLLNNTSPYADYKIVGIDHRLENSFIWTWPWDTTVRVQIVERIPSIDGRAKASTADQVIAATGSVYPPIWTTTRYRATLEKENGQWRIKELVKDAIQPE